jgi:hypothetical protein
MESANSIDHLSNIDVVVFALYLLDGVMKKVHTEEIAVKCHELAPEKFSWELSKYKNYPDRQATFWALQDARKDKNGHLIEGRGGRNVFGDREGWQLTVEGVKWLKEQKDRIATALQLERPQIKHIERGRFLKKIKKEEAFIAFIRDGNLDNVSRYNFTDFLGSPPDASVEMIFKKFVALKAKAELMPDEDLDTFLDLCEQKFEEIIYP